MMPAVGELTTYRGSCHCGQVTFEVKMDLALPVVTCNCSICQRTGTMLSFVPASSFSLLGGEESLTDYQFGRKNIHHTFCSRCGVKSFARGTGQDGKPIVAVNVRCLEDIDLDKVEVRRFNGRAL
jgi:hypothetical protein